MEKESGKIPKEIPAEISRADVIPLMKQYQFDWEELQDLYTSSEEQPQLDQDSSGRSSQMDQ